jgi:NAD(P)-dependent dehydrogenase (short-subunit alcohol dehydrogenase family)
MSAARSLHDLFSLEGKLALVTGGVGVLGSAMCRGLALAGAHVIVTHRTEGAALDAAAALRASGHRSTGLALDTLDAPSLEGAAARTRDLGGVDILINAVGGNRREATTGPERSFASLSREATAQVFALNFFGGAFSTAQAFAPQMVEKAAGGVILNVTSMSALRPLSRVPGYSAAKAAVDNFTRWLAVHLAEEHNPRVRVNAVAPGFFLTAQNRFLLTDEATGEPTPRGWAIVDHTPMGRFGEPDDLIGTVVWLCSDAARFVTGITVAVDGGFSAGCGV